MTKKFVLYYVLGAIVTGLCSVTAYARAVETGDWRKAEQQAHNAVVQVLATHTEFNWQEPYKSPQQREGAGSGFFIDEKGHFLTNYHVVDQAKNVTICIPALGRQQLSADIVGVCPEADIALCKIDAQGVSAIKQELGKVFHLTLGDSDIVYPTQQVLAVGYPMGQRYQKSTIGGFAGREYIGGFSYMHITAPINPGNSGGPLLNDKGEVIGVNSAIIAGAQNIGYSVPSNDVKIILQQLHTIKLLHKPRLGIMCNAGTDEQAKVLNNPLPAGEFINDVIKDSVADKAGVLPGDMLYAINGYKVDQYGDVTVGWRSSGRVSLDEFLIRLPFKAPVELTIYRKGVLKKLRCTFDAPPLPPVRWIYPEYETQAIEYELIGGLCIMQLRSNHINVLSANPAIRINQLQKYMDCDNQNEEVLIVTRVLPGSPIHKINCICDGDLLASINNKQVKTLADLRKALSESVKTGFVTITNKNKVSTVVSLDVILENENRLAQDLMFNVSPFVKSLQKQRKKFLAKTATTKTKK
jgi:serine protease Do